MCKVLYSRQWIKGKRNMFTIVCQQKKGNRMNYSCVGKTKLSGSFRTITPACWLTVDNWTCLRVSKEDDRQLFSWDRIQSLMDRHHVASD